MNPAKSRVLSILVIAACLALGTIVVINRSNMWPFFAAVFFGIALINFVSEMLLLKRSSKRKSQAAQPALRQDTDTTPQG